MLVIVMTRQGTKLCLEKNGVKVISANENISEGSEDIILESVLEGILQQTYQRELFVV